MHGLSIPLGESGYLAPRTFSRVLSETLSDEPRAVEARRRIPVLGKYLVGQPSGGGSRRVQRSTVISGPLDPHHPQSEARTSGDPLQAAAASSAASQIEVELGMITPILIRREREVRLAFGRVLLPRPFPVT